MAILWDRQDSEGMDSVICLMKPLWFREARWLGHGHTGSAALLEDKVGHRPEAQRGNVMGGRLHN